MIFSFDHEQNAHVATIQNGDKIDHYGFSIHFCENPVCTCGSIQLHLFLLGQEELEDLSFFHTVSIDVIKKKLDYFEEDLESDQIADENLQFAETLISNMEDDDFHYLWKRHFAFKNKLTREAAHDSIQAHFDYEEVERNGLMSAYNDVLPFGDELLVTIREKDCIIFDQYCLFSGCPCSDASLSVFLAGEFNVPGEELITVSLDYRKIKWELPEEINGSVDLNTLRSAVEEQIPDIYERLADRHKQLKSIYASCKRKHDAHTAHQPQEAGRNDPCPCGSGKKFKKCCLRN